MIFCLYMYDLMKFILKPDVKRDIKTCNFWQHVNKTLTLLKFSLVLPWKKCRLSL